MDEFETIIDSLKSQTNPTNITGMKRFGIDTTNALGIPIPVLRKLAKPYKKNHSLALKLWNTGIHEAKIMASMVDDPNLVTEDQFNNWSMNFNSWDVCDQVCMNLFSKSPLALDKIREYSSSEFEFVKRVSFVLMACFALKRINATDDLLLSFFPIIENESNDQRNFVKKAVNWALRQIGKKNQHLRKAAILCALRIQKNESKSAKWIANDAIKELTKNYN